MPAILRALAPHLENLETLALLILVPLTILAILTQLSGGPITVLALAMVLLLGGGGLFPFFVSVFTRLRARLA
jgi:hypothetical protein